MNVEQFEGNWEQIKGQVKDKWSKFTSEDLASIRGKKDQLLGKLRERYGFTDDQAKAEFGAFMKDCNCSTRGAVATSKAKL